MKMREASKDLLVALRAAKCQSETTTEGKDG